MTQITEAQKTPWFLANVKPVRVGVYECESAFFNPKGVTLYAFWDGLEFHAMDVSVDGAANFERLCRPAAGHVFRWRGVRRAVLNYN